MANNASYVPSSADLLMVVPRLARKLGQFAINALPEQMESVVGKLRSGGSVIAEATTIDMVNTTSSNTTAAFAQAASTVARTAAAAATPLADQGGFVSYITAPFNSDTIRGFGGMFSYLGSRWALTTFVIACLPLSYSSLDSANHFYRTVNPPQPNSVLRLVSSKPHLQMAHTPLCLLITHPLSPRSSSTSPSGHEVPDFSRLPALSLPGSSEASSNKFWW